jgi:murein DD-endopeptidase MepM/ murein hydrolase activator NlpD
MRSVGRIKPGWYVLAALSIYVVVATTQWMVAAAALREARFDGLAAGNGDTEVVALSGGSTPDGAPAAAGLARPNSSATAADGLWFPIPGARLPSDDAHLPGAERAYRRGTSQGFTFWPETSGVPIVVGTPVIAAGDGVVVRADEPFVELTRIEWDDLLGRVADGADERDLDLLRGRQVWIELDDGRLLRYGHLASVRAGLSVGSRVTRGRVIGTVGNSGTGDAVAGRTTNARLHFEVWDAGTFLGDGHAPDEIRLAAASLFTGP